MNPFEMVVDHRRDRDDRLVLRAKYGHSRPRSAGHAIRTEQAENHRLREEVKELKERLQVLERITVDKENSLASEIEELRDR